MHLITLTPKLSAIRDKVPPSLRSPSGIVAIASSSWGKVLARKMGSNDWRYIKVKDHIYAYSIMLKALFGFIP